MLVFSKQVFDEIITGTGVNWVSDPPDNGLLGSADRLLVIAYATNVTETTGTLRIYRDESADNQNWWQPLLTPTIGTTFGATSVVMKGEISQPLSFVRLRITMLGTNPQCRLKVTVVGRSS